MNCMLYRWVVLVGLIALSACQKTVIIGSNSGSTASTSPEAPIFLVEAAGDGQVQLTWSNPNVPSTRSTSGATSSLDDSEGKLFPDPVENTDNVVTDYVIKYSSDNGANWTVYNDGTSSSRAITIKGLTNGTSYLFKVAAVNPLGLGQFSASSSSLTPAAKPGTPTEVTGTSGNSQVSLSWVSPTSTGGSSLTDYVIQYSSNGGTQWTTFGESVSTTTTTTVTGLTNGTAYIFKVAAVNLAAVTSFSSE